MEIFGIGLPEIIVIAVVALIILGPDRLPEAARTFGKAIADLRRAIEPARTAWADVTREITDVTNSAVQVPGSGNPWTVHPLADGMSPEERDRFFKTGEIPQWKLLELEKMKAEKFNRTNGVETGELSELDYPMPHEEVEYQPAPGITQPLEELSYPEPGESMEKEKKQ